MIPNCVGCKEELSMAYEYYLSKGWHLATTKKGIGIGDRKHLGIIMVNDKGKVMVR